MARREHLDLLNQGVEQWNRWREQHPNIRPDLRYADLSGANLRDADLVDADLSDAHLSCTVLRDADLMGADLSYADLIRTNLMGADLSEANLYSATLVSADLFGTNLAGANLRQANLSEANLRQANLSGADLFGSHLNVASLSDANLSHTNLSSADLSGVDLRNTNLHGANLAWAEVFYTIFARVDLRSIEGLAELNHLGPSQIELHTIQLPQDGSALHFLRGIGVPDERIDDYRARMMHPIQYHSCFISYSSKDETLAQCLHADLQDHGVRCWFAPHDMKIGDKIRMRIDEAIYLQEKLLLLLSEHALASDWVEIEVEAALEKERKQGCEVLFPVRLDECIMQTSQTWAKQLRRSRHIGNFMNWTDPHAYQQAFDRLLRDLKKADT